MQERLAKLTGGVAVVRVGAPSEAANAQRKLCRDWLIFIMASSSVRTRTKDDMREEAIKRFKVSKSAFDVAWIWAIEKTGNRHWYEPLPKSRKKPARTLLT